VIPKSEQQIFKYKLMRLENGIEYLGRLNHRLTVDEICENMKELENAKLSPSSSIVKLSLKHPPPSGRDYIHKMLYDKLRNKEKFNAYTKISTKKSRNENGLKGRRLLKLESKTTLVTESILSENSVKREQNKIEKLLKKISRDYGGKN
jgi:hypothetical protein